MSPQQEPGNESSLTKVRLYHLCSIAGALQIAKSGAIWSKHPAGFANFSFSRNPQETTAMATNPDISLTLVFTGELVPVSNEFRPEDYEPNILYVHQAEVTGPTHPRRKNRDLRIARLAPGSKCCLECVGYVAATPFMERQMNDIRASILDERLEHLLSGPCPIRIPADETERTRIRTEFQPEHVGISEILRMKFMRFRHWQFG